MSLFEALFWLYKVLYLLIFCANVSKGHSFSFLLFSLQLPCGQGLEGILLLLFYVI